MPSLPATVAALLVATLLATSPPARANDPDPGPPDSLRIGPIDPNWIRVTAGWPARPDTDEHQLSRAYPDNVVRWGNLLALKLNNGKYLWLVDMEGHASGFGSSELYQLQDYWPDLGLYIVRVMFNEYLEHWLISARTAKVTKLYAAAYRDPATPGAFITVGIHTMGGISAEVWEGQGDTWLRQYKCDYLADDAEFLRWDGPGRAILAARNPIHRTQEFLLTKTDGKWHTDACKDP